MKYKNWIILYMLILVFWAWKAFAVTHEHCASIGKSFVRSTVTKNGNYRRAYCRKASKHRKLSKAQRKARLENALRAHPELSDVIKKRLSEIE